MIFVLLGPGGSRTCLTGAFIGKLHLAHDPSHTVIYSTPSGALIGLMAHARPITRGYIPGAVSNEMDGVHARHTILSTSAPVCPVKDDRKADFQPNLNVPE